MAHSQVRQNFHKDCEDAINKQINLELHASYCYLALAYYCNREDIALPGFFKYFKDASEEEREHAYKLLEYQNKRGGRVVLTDVPAPEKQEWASMCEAMNFALELEKRVNENLLHLHSIASGHMDINLCDFLDTHYLQEQVDGIKEIADHITNLKRVGEGLGVAAEGEAYEDDMDDIEDKSNVGCDPYLSHYLRLNKIVRKVNKIVEKFKIRTVGKKDKKLRSQEHPPNTCTKV